MVTSSKPQNSDDFRKYLDERFNSLHFRLDIITKNQEQSEVGVKELAHIVDTMRQVDLIKCNTCINTIDLKQIKKDVSEILFIKKYYKPFLVTAAVTIISMIYTGNEAYTTIKTSIKIEAQKNEIEQKQLLEKVTKNSNVINNNAEIQKDQIDRENELNNKK